MQKVQNLLSKVVRAGHFDYEASVALARAVPGLVSQVTVAEYEEHLDASLAPVAKKAKELREAYHRVKNAEETLELAKAALHAESGIFTELEIDEGAIEDFDAFFYAAPLTITYTLKAHGNEYVLERDERHRPMSLPPPLEGQPFASKWTERQVNEYSWSPTDEWETVSVVSPLVSPEAKIEKETEETLERLRARYGSKFVRIVEALLTAIPEQIVNPDHLFPTWEERGEPWEHVEPSDIYFAGQTMDEQRRPVYHYIAVVYNEGTYILAKHFASSLLARVAE
jgi:hypothetical protein